MMHARAVATPLVEMRDYDAARGAIDAGIEAIRAFLEDYRQTDNAEDCAELNMLVQWREHLQHQQTDDASKAYRPPEPRQLIEDLRMQLQAAIDEERFEEAARLRDRIRQVSRGPSGLNRGGL
jgi:excinuclease UvrABC helicase subunit UvrB